jgi:hypothetical protein
MSRLAVIAGVALAVLVSLLVAPPAVPAPAAGAPAADRVVLDGVTVRLRPRTRQVVTVNRTRGHHARVAFWVKRGERCVRRMETTHRADDGWHLDYRRIRPGDFWVQDNASRFYNRHRHRSRGGFRWWLPKSHPDASERLNDCGRQYGYAVVVGLNPHQVRHRGSGIVLHVNGRGATAGRAPVTHG